MAVITGQVIVPAPPKVPAVQDDIKFAESTREERDHLGNVRPQSGSGNASYSRSRSRSYDYTGMDKAHEISQQAAAGDGALYDAAMKDPMSIPGLTERIGAMQRYVNAYKSGQDLPDQVVLPARRLASESDSFSISRGRAKALTRDKIGKSVKEVSPLKDPPVKPGDKMPDSMRDNLPSENGVEEAMEGDPRGQFGPPGDGGPPPIPAMPGDDDMKQLPKERVDPGMSEGAPEPVPQMRGGMKTYSNDQAMLEDPTSILKRIQEEMGLV